MHNRVSGRGPWTDLACVLEGSKRELYHETTSPKVAGLAGAGDEIGGRAEIRGGGEGRREKEKDGKGGKTRCVGTRVAVDGRGAYTRYTRSVSQCGLLARSERSARSRALVSLSLAPTAHLAFASSPIRFVCSPLFLSVFVFLECFLSFPSLSPSSLRVNTIARKTFEVKHRLEEEF